MAVPSSPSFPLVLLSPRPRPPLALLLAASRPPLPSSPTSLLFTLLPSPHPRHARRPLELHPGRRLVVLQRNLVARVRPQGGHRHLRPRRARCRCAHSLTLCSFPQLCSTADGPTPASSLLPPHLRSRSPAYTLVSIHRQGHPVRQARPGLRLRPPVWCVPLPRARAFSPPSHPR